MRYALVLWVGLLTGCDKPYGEGLAGDPLWHEAQRVLHIAGDSRPSTAIAEAYRRRFFDGKGGPDEFETLEQLPPIPSTFDAPLEPYPDQSRRLLPGPRAAHE